MDYKPFDIKQLISSLVRPRTMQQATIGLSWTSAAFLLPLVFIRQGLNQDIVWSIAGLSVLISPLFFCYYAISFLILSKKPVVLPSQSYVFFDSQAKSSHDRFADFATQNGFRYLPGSGSIDLSDLADCSIMASPKYRKRTTSFRIDGNYRGYSFSLTSMNVWTVGERGPEVIGVLRLGVAAALVQTDVRAVFETQLYNIGVIDTVEYDNTSVFMISPGGIPSAKPQMLQLFELFDIAIKCAAMQSDTK
jgi:hypothetical protein